MESIMRYVSVLLMGVLLWAGCSNSKQETTNEEIQRVDLVIPEFANAKHNVETVCQACHHPTAAPQDRIAPPLEIAKRNYMASTNSKEEFVDKMVQFILNPTAEQSILHSDVEQYGLMDPVGFSREDVKEIAEYIYSTDLEKPDWLMEVSR